jgi:hypothetical protein
MLSIVDCFQWRGREVVGGARAKVAFGWGSLRHFCCELGRKASINRCARAWKREWDQREGARYRWLVKIDELLWLFLRALVGDSICLTVFQRGKKSERGEEEVGSKRGSRGSHWCSGKWGGRWGSCASCVQDRRGGIGGGWRRARQVGPTCRRERVEKGIPVRVWRAGSWAV